MGVTVPTEAHGGRPSSFANNEGAAQVPRGTERRRQLMESRTVVPLLFWQHGIFHGFANTELQRSFRWNLDCFASCRITTLAGLSFGFDEFTESGKDEFAVRLHFTCSE